MFEEHAEDEPPSAEEATEIQRALTNGVPDGWTVEAFTAWLDGPTPEGWTDEQWTTYVQDAKAELSSSPAAEG